MIGVTKCKFRSRHQFSPKTWAYMWSENETKVIRLKLCTLWNNEDNVPKGYIGQQCLKSTMTYLAHEKHNQAWPPRAYTLLYKSWQNISMWYKSWQWITCNCSAQPIQPTCNQICSLWIRNQPSWSITF